MDGMMWFFYSLVAVCSVAGVIATSRDGFRRRRLADFARRFDLVVPHDLEAQLMRRVGTPLTAMSLGSLVGAVVGVAITAALIPPPDYSRPGPLVEPALIVMLVTLLSGAVLFQVVAGVAVTLRRPAGRRVARGTTTGLGDYVSGLERSGPWIAVVASLLLTAAIPLAEQVGGLQNVIVPPGSAFSSGGAFYAYLAGGSLIAGYALSGFVLHIPQRVGSPIELAWDDAFRAMTFRGLVGMPLVGGQMSLMNNFADLFFGSTWHSWLLELVAVQFVIAAIAAAGIYFYGIHRSASDRYFQRRLWTRDKVVAR